MSFPNPADLGSYLGDRKAKVARERRQRRAMDRDLAARGGAPVRAFRRDDDGAEQLVHAGKERR